MTRAQEQALAAVARRQGSLVRHADVDAIGASGSDVRRLLRHGSWQTVLPGVLAPAAVAVDRALLERAAMLWLPPSGALSHYSAARYLRIWVPDDDRAWVTVPFASRFRSCRGVEVVRTRHLPPAWRTDGTARWTAAARTVVDLAMVCNERELTAALLSAVRHGATTAKAVERAAVGLDGRAGLQLLRRVISRWRPERESMLEDVLYDDVRAVSPLTVVRQHVVVTRAGAVLARSDVAVPKLRLAFEADGFAYHSTDPQLARDQQRDRKLLAAGWQTLRFREGPLDDRLAVRRDIAAVIEQRRRELGAA